MEISDEMTCIFCQIAKGILNAYIVYEDNSFLSFLDQQPLFLGHCLVIPKMHIATYYDIPPSLLEGYSSRIQIIGKAIERAVAAEGSFLATNNNVSQSVKHVHTHVVPRNKKDGLRGFFWPRNKYSAEQMQEVQQKIINNLLP